MGKYELFLCLPFSIITDDSMSLTAPPRQYFGPVNIDKLRNGAKEFLNNNGKDPKLSDSPDKAIISLVNSRGTSYEMYIAVQNELTAAYNELRDEAAIKKYNLNYTELAKDKKKEIRKMYPMKISEAPPGEF